MHLKRFDEVHSMKLFEHSRMLLVSVFMTCISFLVTRVTHVLSMKFGNGGKKIEAGVTYVREQETGN